MFAADITSTFVSLLSPRAIEERNTGSSSTSSIAEDKWALSPVVSEVVTVQESDKA
jgi:hypothetical protein